MKDKKFKQGSSKTTSIGNYTSSSEIRNADFIEVAQPLSSRPTYRNGVDDIGNDLSERLLKKDDSKFDEYPHQHKMEEDQRPNIIVRKRV